MGALDFSTKVGRLLRRNPTGAFADGPRHPLPFDAVYDYVAHAGGPGGAHDFFCGGVGDSNLAAAPGGTTKAELGYLQARVSDLSPREFRHLTVLRWVGPAVIPGGG
jgi:hypothetical protein